jgi:eukaryotic-like serine/threonine-protein kinase
MTLPAGTRLGPFEILAPIGAGGMGEVYRARDARLGRDVALKVLPPEFANDPNRLKRFEKEARGASGLNHPSIVTIYETGLEGLFPFIAMELVSGRTLREVMTGPMAMKKILAIASQLADGLAVAHEAGLVHRDLKPDNVMITRDGLVKILDFGLAKLTRRSLGDGEGKLPTLSQTEPGGILGTVGYMSPEQAAGQPAGFASDQFAFGSIVYEMAAGRRAFEKPTAVDTLAAILHEEPESLERLAPNTPAPLRWIVERCLVKDPGERYADTRDLTREIRSLSSHLALSDAGAPHAAASPRSRRFPRATLLGIAAAGVLTVVFFLGRTAAARHAPQASISARRVTFQRGSITNARFAPDGTTVVYSAAWEGRPQEVYVARLDSPDSRPLGIPRAQLLSVSRSGELALLLKEKYLGSARGTGTLSWVSIVGGTPRQVVEDLDRRVDWAPDGKSLAAVRRVQGVEQIEYPIGTSFFVPSGPVRSIRVSPDGARVAFIDGSPSPSIVIADRSGKRDVLASGFAKVSEIAWSPDRDEVWFSGVRGGGAQGIFAASAGREPRLLWRTLDAPVLMDVGPGGTALVKIESMRKELWFGGKDRREERELSWLDRSQLRGFSWDGHKVLTEETGPGGGDVGSIYLRNTDGSPAVRLGSGAALDLSPDGRRVLALDRGRLVILPTGPGSMSTVPVGNLSVESASWVPPEARQILMYASAPGQKAREYVMDLPDGSPRPIGPEGIVWGSISNDGQWAIAGPERHWSIYRTDGTPARSIPGLDPGEVGIIWNSKGTAIYLTRGGEVPLRIYRIDLATGQRTLWKSFQPSDLAGVVEVNGFAIAVDDATYVYAVDRVTASDLYVIRGLR